MPAATGLEEFIDRRAQTLAKVFLTRRPDVRIQEFGQAQLDFVAMIEPEPGRKVQNFEQFGVIVRGTDRALPDAEAAAKSASGWWPTGRRGSPDVLYFYPVLALHFSMQDDIGYYAWFAKPFIHEDRPFIDRQFKPDFAPIRKNSLNEVVAEVRAWYERLHAVVYSHE